MKELKQQSDFFVRTVQSDPEAFDDHDTMSVVSLSLELGTAHSLTEEAVLVWRATGGSVAKAKPRAASARSGGGDVPDYRVAVREGRFDTASFVRAGSFKFATEALALARTAMSRARLSRIASEIASLQGSLPLGETNMIALRVDEERPDCLKAIITGPEDTPYSFGCYLFDIFLPSTYPQTPPKVLFVNPSGTRQNPNLYNDGKVCLSLLGTWAGPGWDPKCSTLLQVLVSIQSLILVERPYFNEPGYEREEGTPTGDSHSQAYNRPLRQTTLQWHMLQPLRNPACPFHDVVQTHFRCLRERILSMVSTWSTSYSELRGVAAELATELGKL
jgi:ubiquitin-protein ligase